MKPKSDNLFHFTKSLDILELILENGICPRYCLEDTKWMLSREEHEEEIITVNIAIAMSCFCDIPLSRISEHTNSYGNYGIGLTKNWGFKNNLNPVIYTPNFGIAANAMRRFLGLINKSKKDSKEYISDGTEDQILSMMSLMKQTSGTIKTPEGEEEKDFYQENEWRYVPKENIPFFEDDDSYEAMKGEGNKEISTSSLKFTPNDIRYLFVKCDNDIPPLIDFINVKLDKYPLNDLKILQSRIISLETLSSDL